MTGTRQPHIDRCFDIDEATSVPPERARHELNPDGELSQIDRIRDLAITVGSIALNGSDRD